MIVKTLGLMTLNNNTNMVPNGIANNTPPERTSIPSMPRVEGLTNAWVLASVGVLVGLVLGLIGCIAICDVMLFGDNTGVSEAKEGTEAKDGTEGKKGTEAKEGTSILSRAQCQKLFEQIQAMYSVGDTPYKIQRTVMEHFTDIRQFGSINAAISYCSAKYE